MKKIWIILLVLAFNTSVATSAQATHYYKVHYHHGKRCTQQHYYVKSGLHIIHHLLHYKGKGHGGYRAYHHGRKYCYLR